MASSRSCNCLSRIVLIVALTPRIARLATISPNGYPHLVPIWFLVEGEDLLFGTERSNRKVKNLLLNPKGAVVIGGEPEADGVGYLIQGDLHIIEDVGFTLTHRLIARYESDPDVAERTIAQFTNQETIFPRITPQSLIRVY